MQVDRARKEQITKEMIGHLALRRRIVVLREALEDVVRVTNPGDRAHELAQHGLKNESAIEMELYQGTYHDSAERVSHSVSGQRNQPQRALR